MLKILENGNRYRLLAGALATALGATCGLIGCATPAGDIFPPIEPAIAWPLPPEQPRIQSIGQIRTSEDLQPAKSGWQALQERLHPEELRPIALNKPHALVVKGTRVYVADAGAACLHMIDLEQRTHRRINSAGGERLASPVGVAAGPSSIFVTDAVLADVIEFSVDGEFVRRLDLELERPAGIVYCPANDRLYVVDTSTHRCVMLQHSDDPLMTWTMLGEFGGRGTEPGMFNFPTHMTYHPLLGLIIADTLNFRVQLFDLDGTFQSSIGQKGDGAGDFSLPKGVAVDRDGHIYVIDAHFENVQIFQSDGQLLLAFGSEGAELGQFAVPAGITIDDGGRIWVADSYNHRLQVFQYLSPE